MRFGVLRRTPAMYIPIAIDVNERYPWKFAGHDVRRENLPVGDYALLDPDGRPLAIVERKTFANLLAEFGRMAAFHQQLSELEAFRHSALVIEAAYEEYGDVPEATGGRRYDIRRAILHNLPEQFTRAQIRDAFPGVPDEEVTRVLHRLRAGGLVRCHGRGRGAWWERVEGTKPGPEE